LIIWATWPHLPRIPELLKAWGFRYSTGRPWLKTWSKEDGTVAPLSQLVRCRLRLRDPQYQGIPHHRGRPQRLDGIKVAGHIIAPRREHSHKPDCVRDEIVELLDGPRCELFARSRHPGFDSRGNEVDRFMPEVLA
jgi:N6-adenosine-specific RNA methylase IME4